MKEKLSDKVRGMAEIAVGHFCTVSRPAESLEMVQQHAKPRRAAALPK